MRAATGGVSVVSLVLATLTPPLRADGGSLRFSAVQEAYRISVFTAPTPFRQGPVDVSILVQDCETGELVTSATVIVRITRTRSRIARVSGDRPGCHKQALPRRAVRASRAGNVGLASRS